MNPRPEPVHCHVFKPRADGATPVFKADLKSRMFPPVDMWKDVTADTGSTCDTRTYKDGISIPIPPGGLPIPPKPPIEPPDATGDNVEATADTTSTTADAGAVYAYDFTTDTTLIFADRMSPTADAFPHTVPPKYAGTTWEETQQTCPRWSAFTRMAIRLTHPLRDGATGRQNAIPTILRSRPNGQRGHRYRSF